jgi:DNA-binding transcriptional MerR regulator
MEKSYSAKMAAEVTGADYYNILYWVRTGLVKASVQYIGKQKAPVLFSFWDLLEIKIIQNLREGERREKKAPIQRIRKALSYLRSLGEEYMDALRLEALVPGAGGIYLDVTGDDIQAYFNDDQVISAVKNRGQTLLVNILKMKDEVQKKLTEVEGNKPLEALATR